MVEHKFSISGVGLLLAPGTPPIPFSSPIVASVSAFVRVLVAITLPGSPRSLAIVTGVASSPTF